MDEFELFDLMISTGRASHDTAGTLGDGDRVSILVRFPDDHRGAGENLENLAVLEDFHLTGSVCIE